MGQIWLTPDEVVELTTKQRWTAQVRALVAMKVPFRLNAVGRPLVERGALVKNDQQPTSARKKKVEPDFSCFRRGAA